MYFEKLLLLRLDAIQNDYWQLTTELNSSDSLLLSKLSDLNTNLSQISTCIVEHSKHTFLGVSWDILLPACITIVVFMLGNWVNSIHQRKHKRNERELVKNTIITWADNNLETLQKYVKDIRKLSENIQNVDNLEGPVSANLQHLTIDVLAQFSIDRLTDALSLGLKAKQEEKGKMLNDLLTTISFNITIIQYVNKTYEEYTTSMESLLDEWNVSWRACTYDMSKNLNRLNSDRMEQAERSFYKNLSNLFHSTLNTNPKQTQSVTQYFKLLEDCKIYLGMVKENTPATLETGFILGEAYITASKILALKGYGDIFSQVAENVEKSIKQFIEAVDFYRHHDVVGRNLRTRKKSIHIG